MNDGDSADSWNLFAGGRGLMTGIDGSPLFVISVPVLYDLNFNSGSPTEGFSASDSFSMVFCISSSWPLPLLLVAIPEIQFVEPKSLPLLRMVLGETAEPVVEIDPCRWREAEP